MIGNRCIVTAILIKATAVRRRAMSVAVVMRMSTVELDRGSATGRIKQRVCGRRSR